jgi:hypothetical protein
VIEHVRAGVEYRPQRGLQTLEIRDQDLYTAAWHAFTGPTNRLREDERAAIRQIIAID